MIFENPSWFSVFYSQCPWWPKYATLAADQNLKWKLMKSIVPWMSVWAARWHRRLPAWNNCKLCLFYQRYILYLRSWINFWTYLNPLHIPWKEPTMISRQQNEREGFLINHSWLCNPRFFCRTGVEVVLNNVFISYLGKVECIKEDYIARSWHWHVN